MIGKMTGAQREGVLWLVWDVGRGCGLWAGAVTSSTSLLVLLSSFTGQIPWPQGLAQKQACDLS